MKKISCRWIPRLLITDNKEQRHHASRRFLSQYRREGTQFLDKIITTDETWMYLYDPQTKEQSKQWKTPASPQPKKARVVKSTGKQMYIFFADRKGMLLQHAVPIGQSVNSSYYSKVIRRDLTRDLHRKRPGVCIDSMLLHHTASTTILELDVLGLKLVEHPPYSPDLAPMDFKVFPTVKSELKGYRFDDFEELGLAIQRVVASLSEDWYQDMFAQWVSRHRKCVTTCGDYVEK